MKPKSPKQQLDGFIARFSPEIRALGKAALAKMRPHVPAAIEMVYDNYNGLVIGFCPNDRPSDAIFSIAIFPRSVALCFLQGAKLADPNKLLLGSGTVARHIRLERAADFDKPAVKDLINRALKSARVRMPKTGKHRLVIKSISAKQRPRRPD